jgi:TolB protein
MAADGSYVKRLTNDGADEESPRWSPKGDLIAYAKMDYFSDRGLIANPAWDIFVMNADGSHQIQLTHNPANELEPSWSADGEKIVFISDRNGPDFDIY